MFSMTVYLFCPNRYENNSCAQLGVSCQHPSGECEDRTLALVRQRVSLKRIVEEVKEVKEPSKLAGVTCHGDIIRRISSGFYARNPKK